MLTGVTGVESSSSESLAPIEQVLLIGRILCASELDTFSDGVMHSVGLTSADVGVFVES